MKLTIPLRNGTNLTLEGTCDELLQVAERLVEQHGQFIPPGEPSQVGPLAPAPKGGANRRWTEQSTHKLWGLLYGDQAKLVRFLVERGGKAKYTELAKHMGYKAQHLSGILSPITRNAQTATGDRLARLVDWRIPDDGQREYYLDADALAFFQQIIGQP